MGRRDYDKHTKKSYVTTGEADERFDFWLKELHSKNPEWTPEKLTRELVKALRAEGFEFGDDNTVFGYRQSKRVGPKAGERAEKINVMGKGFFPWMRHLSCVRLTFLVEVFTWEN